MRLYKTCVLYTN